MADEPTIPRPKVVTDAIAFQKASENGFAAQRKREPKDLACQVPENLWPDEVKQARMGSTIGGVTIPPRPMLSIDKLGQPVKLQMNQLRRAHLGVHISPVGKKANAETAQTLQGLYRAIERDSHANIGRCWGSDRALKCGLGWYRVNVVYDDTTDDPFDLTIRIERILRQGSVFPDPFAQEPDFCDGKRLLYVSFMAEDVYKNEYKGSKLASYDDDGLNALRELAPFWFEGEKENRAICVAEFFYTEYKDREWVIADDGSFMFADEVPEGRTIPQDTKRRKVKEPILKWAKINACEVLEETTWNGKYIPFIPCVGDELQPFDSERRWFGLYSTNQHGAHLFNVAVSNAVETAALEPKATWKGPVGSFKTNNKQWQVANTRNLPYLEYDPVVGPNGQLAPAPERETAQKSLGNNIALIEIADNILQAGTAMYDALLGKSERDDPARKVLALQDQSLASNSHWIANLADISMPYEAKVVLDLIPRVYDRPGRVAQLVGEDNEQREVMLNQPFTVDDDKRPVAVDGWQEGQPLPQGAKYYDVTSGTYGVAVTIGKSYPTRAREGADGFSQMIQAAPEYMLPRVGDIWMGFQEFPGHELAAKRLKAGLPPELANVDNEDDKPDPQALQLELQKAEQAMQMMQKMLSEQQKAIETDAIKTQGDLQRAELDAKKAITIEQMKGAHAIALQKMKDEHALALKRLEFEFKDHEREDEQAHDTALASADAAAAKAQAETAAKHAAAMAAAGAMDADSKADRAHAHGMESQTQAEGAAAAAKPKPNGASA